MINKCRKSWGVWILLSCLTAHSALGAVLAVPGDFATINEALKNAQPGDQILLAPGLYPESGLKLVAGISLSGAGASPEATVIDGQGNGRVMSALGLAQLSVLENLTIANGWASSPEGYDAYGGGLYVNDSPLLVRNCRFVGNRAEASGGAVSLMLTQSQFLDCYFVGNTATKGGGGLDCTLSASPTIRDTEFAANQAGYGGALSCRSDSDPLVEGCLFRSNKTGGEFDMGGAVMVFLDSDPALTGCTFTANLSGAGGALFLDSGAPTSVVNCTFHENTGAVGGAGIFCNNGELALTRSLLTSQQGVAVECMAGVVPAVTATNIHGNTGGDWTGVLAAQAEQAGNLSVNPLFCKGSGVATGTFYLEEGSPCASEGGTGLGIGAWPVGCESGSGTSRTDQLPDSGGFHRVSAYPNPFNPRTLVTFELPASRRVRIAVFNLKGQRVAGLADRTFPAGGHGVPWEGLDDQGRQVPSGTYFVVLQDGRHTRRTKVTLLK